MANLVPLENHENNKKNQIEELYNCFCKECNVPWSKNRLDELMSYASLEKTKIPEKSITKSILFVWNKWSKYLTQDSYENFMFIQLKELLDIGCSATSVASDLKAYVGAKGTVAPGTMLPQMLHTVITFGGVVRMNGKVVLVSCK